MKKIVLLILICFLLCGCSAKNKDQEVVSFYIGSRNGDSFAYGDLTIDVLDVDNACINDLTCKPSDLINVKVKTGSERFKREYTLTTNEPVVKIWDTKNYLGITAAEDGQILLTVYK